MCVVTCECLSWGRGGGVPMNFCVCMCVEDTGCPRELLKKGVTNLVF